MAYFQAEEKARLKRLRTEQAIALAMQSRWEEAVITNKSIIELFPMDVEAYNRLGKALTELGRYAQAREAYAHALEVYPNNAIARKNLNRLNVLKELHHPPARVAEKVAPDLFVEEMGKTGITTLCQLAPSEVLAKMTTGDRVYIKVKGTNLVVENARGEYLGQVEPKLGLRLINLIQGGNQYDAAIASVGDGSAKIIIKEVYQHPSQRGRLSFPPKDVEAFRPYIRESLLKYGLEEEDEYLEGEEYPPDWGEEEEALREGMHIIEEEPGVSEDQGEEKDPDEG